MSTAVIPNAIAIQVKPRDPIIARDGRPFSAGLRMKSLEWFYPSVLAGSLRTRLGQMNGTFDASLLQCEVAGGLPVVHDAGGTTQGSTPQLHFPAPADAVARSTNSGIEVYAARPAPPPDGCGCDLPDESLQPAVLSESLKGEFKPAGVPRFWSAAMLEQWLCEPAIDACGRCGLISPAPFNAWPAGFLDGPRKDVRMHVKMDPKRGAGEDEKLFQTTGLDVGGLRPHADKESTACPGCEVGLSVRLRPHAGFAAAAMSLDDWGTLGGERRLVHWKLEPALPSGWACPPGVASALQANPSLVRMVLATPGLFSGGWLPGWLRGSGGGPMQGAPPSAPGLALRLVGACVERWRPISGWSLKEGSFGPKRIRRLVPAGAVYFFEVVSGSPSLLASAWMESVCDEEQDRRDGFGLAVWGVWRPHGQPTSNQE